MPGFNRTCLHLNSLHWNLCSGISLELIAPHGPMHTGANSTPCTKHLIFLDLYWESDSSVFAMRLDEIKWECSREGENMAYKSFSTLNGLRRSKKTLSKDRCFCIYLETSRFLLFSNIYKCCKLSSLIVLDIRHSINAWARRCRGKFLCLYLFGVNS